jgi:TfoX/Sxy family transcriptional regulator of competence genes
MPFSETLNNRVREAMMNLPDVDEKYMFGGVCYMVGGKMCVGVMGEQLMCRIGEENYKLVQEKPGCQRMEMAGRLMKGYVLVSEEGWKNRQDFSFWINLCLAFNPEAKAAGKKKSKG